ncbi:MAG: (d)CMP kinase [Planctomycetales bacterium]|nr:(d)CMP kinase [Planctomycetales bacterium]
MIVTIDGPAGAGKSTAAKGLAQRLGFRFLDTGAMYRAVALAGLRQGVDWEDADALGRLARDLKIQVEGRRVLLDGEDVSDAIRSFEITSLTRYPAANPQVRQRLVELQRQAAAGQDVVTEGRDQGTVVFPGAECKIFLTADSVKRAQRRYRDLQDRGDNVPFDEVLARQNQRDQQDTRRDCGPLVPAADAIELATDGLTSQQVVDRLEALVRSRM